MIMCAVWGAGTRAVLHAEGLLAVVSTRQTAGAARLARKHASKDQGCRRTKNNQITSIRLKK